MRLPSYLGIFRSLFFLSLYKVSQLQINGSDPDGVLWPGLDSAVSTTRGRIALAEACGPQCGAGWVLGSARQRVQELVVVTVRITGVLCNKLQMVDLK